MGGTGDDLRHHVAIPLQHPEYDGLVTCVAPALALGLPAHVGFVRFHGSAVPAQRDLAVRLGHVLADLVRHPPRALVGNAKLPLKLFGGHAVAGRGEQVDRIKPTNERSARAFHRGPTHGLI